MIDSSPVAHWKHPLGCGMRSYVSWNTVMAYCHNRFVYHSNFPPNKLAWVVAVVGYHSNSSNSYKQWISGNQIKSAFALHLILQRLIATVFVGRLWRWRRGSFHEAARQHCGWLLVRWRWWKRLTSF